MNPCILYPFHTPLSDPHYEGIVGWERRREPLDVPDLFHVGEEPQPISAPRRVEGLRELSLRPTFHPEAA